MSSTSPFEYDPKRGRARGLWVTNTRARSVALPNSLFLTQPIINESFTQEYVLHSFTVPLKAQEDWKEAERVLLGAAHNACQPHLEKAKKHLGRFVAQEGLGVRSLDPSIKLSIPDPDRINLVLRIPTPETLKGELEHQILHAYLEQRKKQA